MEIHAGEIVGLVGPSGSGKTTLVDLIVGITVPHEGTVTLCGESAPYSTVRKNLGFMPQDIALYEDITAKDNLAFFGALYGLGRKELEEASRWALDLARLEFDRKKIVRDYSGGMKRRLSLAIALINKPKVLVMDEPTVGLDPVHRFKLWNSFREMANEGSAVLVTTHVMEEAEQCDRVAMMRDGRIIRFDTPQTIISEAQADTLEEAFVILSENECDGGERNE